MLVPGQGMLATDKAIILAYKGILLPHSRGCLCQTRECLPHAKAYQ